MILNRFLLIGSCLLSSINAAATPLQKFSILHINDTHSHIEADAAAVQLAGRELYTEIGGMARLDATVEQQRQQFRQQNQPFLLLHGGDAFKGSGYFEVHKSLVNSDLFNLLGIQAMALGNHEFDAGLLELATFAKDARFPLLAANVDASQEPQLAQAIKPYALFGLVHGQLQPVTDMTDAANTVAVIGLALEDMPQIATGTGKLRFLPEVTTTQSLINRLEQQGINKIILLTHLGFERDVAISKQLDGVDVVVGGHSHSYLADLRAWGKGRDARYATQVLNKTRESFACVVTAGQFAHLLGSVELTFDAKGQLQQCKGAAFLLSSDKLYRQPTRQAATIATEPDLQQALRALPNTRVVEGSVRMEQRINAVYKPEVLARYGKKLTTLPASLIHVRQPGSDGSDEHGSRVAPVVATAMLQYVNSPTVQRVLKDLPVDVALLAAGGIRSSIEAGDLLEGHVLMEILPYETPLSVLTVQGRVLRELLYSTISATLAPGAHAGKFPYTAGLRYVALETKPGELHFEQLQIYQQGQWQTLQDNATYRLVTTNYLANGNDGWQLLAKAQTTNTDRIDLALVAGVLKPYAVHRLSENQKDNTMIYSPTYRGKPLECSLKPADLYCGSQNKAFLQYLHRQPQLVGLPPMVTLKRSVQNAQ